MIVSDEICNNRCVSWLSLMQFVEKRSVILIISRFHNTVPPLYQNRHWSPCIYEFFIHLSFLFRFKFIDKNEAELHACVLHTVCIKKYLPLRKIHATRCRRIQKILIQPSVQSLSSSNIRMTAQFKFSNLISFNLYSQTDQRQLLPRW